LTEADVAQAVVGAAVNRLRKFL